MEQNYRVNGKQDTANFHAEAATRRRVLSITFVVGHIHHT